MCHKLGMNTWEVIDAAATKPFGFMKFYPGPGPRRSLHPGRSAVPVVEAAHAQVRGALHRRSPTRSTRTCRTSSSRRRRTRSTTQKKAINGSKRAGARHRLQEGHRRPARVAGARRHRALAAEGRGGQLPRPVLPVGADRRARDEVGGVRQARAATTASSSSPTTPTSTTSRSRPRPRSSSTRATP